MLQLLLRLDMHGETIFKNLSSLKNNFLLSLICGGFQRGEMKGMPYCFERIPNADFSSIAQGDHRWFHGVQDPRSSHWVREAPHSTLDILLAFET